DPDAREAVRQQFSFSDNDIVIGFVGRLHPVKGVDLLVQAMPLLIQENPHFKLMLVGTGPLADSLKKQAHDNGTASHICFAGFQGNVAEIMNAFDIALEMMSMNVPLVCSVAEGLAELVKNRQTALTLKENTPDTIASCILELSRNKDLQEQLKTNASSFCLQFGTQQFTQKIEALYSQ
ncbi:MAG: glycosyltransferase family 4 protein, partial [Planctomycetota bacterium]